MVTHHYEPARLRRNSDIPLGTPTCSARTRHGIWALYQSGADVVVVHPGGAMTGPPAEVAHQLHRLGGGALDDHDRACVRAIGQFLTVPDLRDSPWPAPRARTWSSPAKGYWLSGPFNDQPGYGGRTPSHWPGEPASSRPPVAALPDATRPLRARPDPDPNPEPAPQRAA
jgi:hypothetical protein